MKFKNARTYVASRAADDLGENVNRAGVLRGEGPVLPTHSRAEDRPFYF